MEPLYYFVNKCLNNSDYKELSQNFKYWKTDFCLIGYADDMYLVFKYPKLKEKIELTRLNKFMQNILDKVVNWICDKNLFNISVDKVALLKINCIKYHNNTFTPSQFAAAEEDHSMDPKIYIHSQPIKVERKLKILGLLFDENAKFKQHLEIIKLKAQNNLNLLRVISPFTNPDTKIDIYTSVIRPTLEYGSNVFGEKANECDLKNLETVNNSGMRLCTNAMNTTPIHVLHSATGLPTLEERRLEKSGKYIVNVLNQPEKKWHIKLKPELFKLTEKTPTHDKIIEQIMCDKLTKNFPKIWDLLIQNNIITKKNNIIKNSYYWQELEEEIDDDLAIYENIGAASLIPKNKINTKFLDQVSKVVPEENIYMDIKFQQFLYEMYGSSDDESNVIYYYTDGSKIPQIEDDGSDFCGYGIYEEKSDLKMSVKLKSNILSVYSCEALAILKVLQILQLDPNEAPLKKVVIVTDSKAVLDKLTDIKIITPDTNPIIAEIILTYNNILKNFPKSNINFCYVKAHVGIKPNEIVDKLAKDAFSNPSSTKTFENIADFKTVPKQDQIKYIEHSNKKRRLDTLKSSFSAAAASSTSSSGALKQKPLLDFKGFDGLLERIPYPKKYIFGRNAALLSRCRMGYVNCIETLKFDKPSISVVNCEYCNLNYKSFIKHYFEDCQNSKVKGIREKYELKIESLFESNDEKILFQVLYFLKQLKLDSKI